MLKVDGEEINYEGLPAEHRETVRRYMEGGVYPGSGWMLILTHDLAAVCACDDATVAQLPQIYRWMHNHTPGWSHGSEQACVAWMRERRAKREAA